MIALMFSATARGGLGASGWTDASLFLAFLCAGVLSLCIGSYFLFAESEDPDYAKHR